MISTSSQRGFVLVTTIWMIAIMMLLGALFHGYVSKQLDTARILQSQMQRAIDMRSTEETVLYVILRGRATHAGLTVLPENQSSQYDKFDEFDLTPTGSELRLDGSHYRGIGCGRFAIQGRAGLLAVNTELHDGWGYDDFARTSSATQAQLLTAALSDYVDEDNQRRVGGAERGDYLNIGAPTPPNNKLRSDAEIFSVYGWEKWLSLDANNDWQNWIDIGEYYLLNVNSAPAGLLAVTLDIRRAEAEKLVQARVERPFTSLDEVADKIGRLNFWPEEKFTFNPLPAARLQVWCEGSDYHTVRGFKMTPVALDGPQQTDYYYRRAYDGSKQNTGEILEVAGSLFTHALPANPG